MGQHLCCPLSAQYLPEDTAIRQSILAEEPSEVLPVEKEELRRLQAAAALARSKEFKNGGGGERLKAKTKALEAAEKRNKEIGGPNLKWTI